VRTLASGHGFGLLAGGPGGLLGTDLDVTAGHVVTPGDGIEDEEFGFGAKVGHVADAGGLQVGLGALGDGTRIAVVALAGVGFDDVAGQDEGGLVHEGVDVGGVRIRHEQHVGGLDAFPAGDRGSIEGVAVGELFLVEMGYGHGDVLFLAAGIGKAEIDEFDIVFLDHFHNVGDSHCKLLNRMNKAGGGGTTVRRLAGSMPSRNTR